MLPCGVDSVNVRRSARRALRQSHWIGGGVSKIAESVASGRHRPEIGVEREENSMSCGADGVFEVVEERSMEG
jgi:hypothetical protein